mgnify:CR=1 FL=1
MGEKFDLLVDRADEYSMDTLTFTVIHDCDDDFHDNAPTCWGTTYQNIFIWITKNSHGEYVVEIECRNDPEIRELYKNINLSVVRCWISRNIWRYV